MISSYVDYYIHHYCCILLFSAYVEKIHAHTFRIYINIL